MPGIELEIQAFQQVRWAIVETGCHYDILLLNVFMRVYGRNF